MFFAIGFLYQFGNILFSKYILLKGMLQLW